MPADLHTTNVLLGIMAAVSAFEALLLIATGIAIFMTYRRVKQVLGSLERRHVAPAMFRVNAILDDVKDVTAKVKDETDRVDHAIHSTIERVDDTVGRVRADVRAKANRFVGVIRGLRVMIETLMHSERPRGRRAQAAAARPVM
jgi:hypothetical protein